MSFTALILVARYPRPGEVKTRLARSLGPLFASEFYRACAEDAFQAVRSVTGAVRGYVSLAKPEDLDLTKAWAGPRFTVIPQPSGDFGTRLRDAMLQAHADGASASMVIATDTPGLTAALLRSAVDRLQEADAVLGPSPDGGYYLLGLHTPHPDLFEDMPWSTSEVADTTLRRIERLGWTCPLLPPLQDIDTLDDLNRWLDSPEPVALPLKAIIRSHLAQAAVPSGDAE